MRNAVAETEGISALPIKSFRDLQVYQEGLELVSQIYAVADELPADQQRSLADQMRRASVSVAANVAEGYGKKRSAKQFRAYLDNALGSCNEVGALLDVCQKVGYLGQDEWGRLTEACTRLAKRISTLSQRWE